jgi:hypothetical protein
MTRVEAIKQALENLRVIDAISNPSAEDAVTVGKRLDQVRARLSEIGLVWWTVDDIPDSVVGAFCDLVAEASQAAFGKTYSAPGAQAAIAAVKSSAANNTVQALYF